MRPSERWRLYVWAWVRGRIDRGLLNGGGGSGGSPFTCPRGSMAAHAAPRPYSHPLFPHLRFLTTRTPRPRLQRVSSHATLFQIRPLNRLAAIQFTVLKAIKLGECAPSPTLQYQIRGKTAVLLPYQEMLVLQIVVLCAYYKIYVTSEGQYNNMYNK